MESVTYICKCGRQHTIDQFYYCRGCVEIVCPSCVTELIECSYCPSCLLEISRAQNEISGCRCWRCFECPNCSTSLTQLSFINPADREPRYYFACVFCRWTSLESDISSDSAEGLVLTCIRHEKDADITREFNTKLDQFQQIAKNAIREKSQRSSIIRHPRQRGNVRQSPSPKTTAEEIPDSNVEEPDNAQPIEFGEERVVEEHYNRLTQGILSTFETQDVISGLQRCTQPLYIELLSRRLVPQRKFLISKRSKKCLTCDRYLVWAEAAPKSTGFKAQNLAMSFVPRIVVKDSSQSTDGLHLYLVQISNPTDSPIQIKMSPSAEHAQLGHQIFVPHNPIGIDAYDDDLGLDPDESHQYLSASDNPAFIHQRQGHRVLLWVKSDTLLEKIALDLEIATFPSPKGNVASKGIANFTVVLSRMEQSF